MTSAWFPCYGGDLLSSIRWKRMSPAQRGAYWQLICWQMQSDDGHLDDDVSILSALADLDLSKGHDLVLSAFPVNSNGRRANARALVEWSKRHAISGDRSRAATSRWDAERASKADAGQAPCKSNAIAYASVTHPHPHPHPHPITHTANAREGLLGMADTIRAARPEYAAMREMDIANALNVCPSGKRDKLATAVTDWAADQANAIKPMDNALASIRKLVGRVVEGASGSGVHRRSPADERNERLKRATALPKGE